VVKVLLETPGKLNLLVRESSFITRVIKSKHLEWAKHLARTDEEWSAFNLLVRKCEFKFLT
jgi:hypothetical protein